MRAELAFVAFALGLGLGLGACGITNPDPRKPSIADVQVSGLGAWAEITTTSGMVIDGELISVEPGAVRILPRGSASLVSFAKRDIASGRLFRYVADSGYGGWGVVGTLSTLSHGFWLVFSAPIWIAWSGATSSAEASHVILELKPGAENWAQVAKWARFPQGMPRGFGQAPPGATRAPSVPR